MTYRLLAIVEGEKPVLSLSAVTHRHLLLCYFCLGRSGVAEGLAGSWRGGPHSWQPGWPSCGSALQWAVPLWDKPLATPLSQLASSLFPVMPRVQALLAFLMSLLFSWFCAHFPLSQVVRVLGPLLPLFSHGTGSQGWCFSISSLLLT